MVSQGQWKHGLLLKPVTLAAEWVGFALDVHPSICLFVLWKYHSDVPTRDVRLLIQEYFTIIWISQTYSMLPK